MKIAVVSDTHDNIPNFKKAVSFIEKNKIKLLIHCGDICRVSTLKEILEGFLGEIHIVFGNVDTDRSKIIKISKEDLPQVKVWGRTGEININNKTIAFCHFPELAKDLALKRKYDLVFYGHTHKPWEEKVNETRLVNPGNLAGIFHKPTFALYDTKTDKLELKILEKIK